MVEKGTLRDELQSLKADVSNRLNQAKADVSNSRLSESLSESLSTAGESLSDGARSAADAARSASDAARSAVDPLAGIVKAAVAEIGEALGKEDVQLHKLVAERPVAALTSAFALGIVVGFALRRK